MPELEQVDFNMDKNENCYRSSPPAGDEGLRALANGCPKLTTLMLRGRKKITSHGAVSLLNSNTEQNLTHLDLGYCRLLKNDIRFRPPADVQNVVLGGAGLDQPLWTVPYHQPRWLCDLGDSNPKEAKPALEGKCLNLEVLSFNWCTSLSRYGYLKAFRSRKNYKRILFWS
ncbi:hypothetical protein ACLB2K_017767 [Fragaria x ananassa]